METPNECLKTQLPKNRLRLFMHLLTIMLKKMRSCFLEGSRDLKVKRLDSCLRWKQRWAFGGSTRKLVVFYKKFLQLWDEFYADVVISKPMMDLCLTCQQNTTKLQRAANLSDEEKSDCVKAHQEHLDIAQSKRECYRNPGKECERFLQTIDTNTLLICETRGACSLNASIHYSFDFAQQIHVPSNDWITMDWENIMRIFMRTIAPAKTKPVFSFGTWHTEFCWNFTAQLHTLF